MFRRSLSVGTQTCERGQFRLQHRLKRPTLCSTRSIPPYFTKTICLCSTGQTIEPTEVPATYKRLVARHAGPSFRKVAVVQELPLRPPGPGEVLVQVTHAGINGGCETFRVRGEHAFAANRGMQYFPLGAEGVGVVVALGPDLNATAGGSSSGSSSGSAGKGRGGGALKVGQLVAFNGAAAFSQYVTARPSLVTAVPEGVGGPEAAALVLSGVTAAVALEVTARVRPGEVVVVTAAAGGTGHLAVQLAAAAGAKVVAVVGGERKAAAVAELMTDKGGPMQHQQQHHQHGQGGGVVVVDYHRQDVATTLRRMFPGGVDVVYDGVGGWIRNQLMDCLSPSGRWLQVGYISEYPHTQQYRWDGDDVSNGQGLRGGVDGGVDGGSNGGGSGGGGDGGDRGGGIEVTTEPASGILPAAVTSCTAEEPLPPSSELFWGGLDVTRGQQRVIGQIWPKDLKAIIKCRRRVFDMARRGQLRVLTDQGHGRRGLEGVADAVDYMLGGEHVGKVIIEL